MDINKLTLKSKEALAEAERQARARNHQQVEPEHLLFALLSDPEGVVFPPAARHVLERAAREAEELTDEYISTEHLLLAMLEGGAEVPRLLADAGIARDRVLSSLAEVRGRQRVTDETPEDKYQALERYGRDLTDLARKGRLDPVIGRDDEIRRVIQVLSRRTK